MTRILYHHRTGSRDGQYVHISELQAALRAQGCELCEVGPSTARAVRFGAEDRVAAAVKAVVPKLGFELIEYAYNAVVWSRLRRAMREFRPDLLYERYALNTFGGTLAAGRRLPLFLEVNAPLALERARYGGLALARAAARVERFALTRATRVLAVTGVLKRMLVAEGAAEADVVVIPNGIDPSRFDAHLASERCKAELGLSGKLVLGFSGFYRDWHRVDRVLSFLHRERTRLPALHFWLVGDGPVRGALEAQARALGIADRVTFVGTVERDRIAKHVAAFDIALQPDVTEYASPLKLFEYMALKRAIIAPDRENIREVLTHGHDALLFDPGSEDSLVQGLRALAESAELRRRLGEAARRTIDERGFTWQHNARRVLELLEQVQLERAGGTRAASAAGSAGKA